MDSGARGSIIVAPEISRRFLRTMVLLVAVTQVLAFNLDYLPRSFGAISSSRAVGGIDLLVERVHGWGGCIACLGSMV
jgi:hypothetical protein